MGLWTNIKKAVGPEIPETLSLAAPEEIDQRIAVAPPLAYKSKQEPDARDLDPLDPYNMLSPENLGRQHPGTAGHSLSYDALDLLASVPMVQAIISTRINQLAEYASPQRSRFDIGYRVQLRDPRQKTSAASQKRALEIARWLYTCGDPRISENGTLETWMRKVARDSFVYDQLCSEIVYADNGKPAGFLAVDAKTIRRAKLTPSEWSSLQRDPQAGYVQVQNNKVLATWDQAHFMFGVRNPRTGIQFNGYGHPELEQAAMTITQMVNATTYNASNFTNGIHAAGIFAITSAMNDQVFKQSERKLRAMMTGAGNAQRVLTMKLDPNQKESVAWHGLTNNNKEMEYSKWIDFLVKVVCACFGMDPTELGFTMATPGSFNSGSAQGERVSTSKERGLRPSVRFIENLLNSRIVHLLDEDFEISLEGFDSATEAVKLDHYGKAVRSYMAVNEVRTLEMLEAFDSEAANNGPIDGVYQSTVQNIAAQAQQQQQMQMQQLGVEQAPPGAEPPPDDAPEMGEDELAALFDSPQEMQKSVALRKSVLASIEV
jgi:hypothetical protein